MRATHGLGCYAVAGSFTVASWNLYQGLHYTSSRRVRTKNDHDIEQHLRALDADVLVLPEAWRWGDPEATWAEDMAQSLGYELHQWVSDRPSRRRELVPFRMVVMTRIAAEPLAPWLMPAIGQFGPRAFVRVRLPEHDVDLAGVHLYGIHLLRQRAPWQWARERAEMRRACAAHDLVAGDLNMWGPVVQRDASGLRRAIVTRTFPAHRPHSQIDHVLIGKRLRVVEAERMDNWGSDHRALRVRLERVELPESD